jgi:hypothetical protein
MTLYEVPQVPVFPAGYDPYSIDFDNWIQSPMAWWTTRVMFRAQLQAAQSFTGGAFTIVQFGSTAGDILEDPWEGWSDNFVLPTGQPAHSWMCPLGCSGWYEVTMTAFTSNPGSGAVIGTGISVDGTTRLQPSGSWGPDGQPGGSCGSSTVWLSAGEDYIQGEIWTTNSTSAPATAGQYPTLEICWISS